MYNLYKINNKQNRWEEEGKKRRFEVGGRRRVEFGWNFQYEWRERIATNCRKKGEG